MGSAWRALVRLLADRSISRLVAARDALVSLSRRRDDGQPGGRRDVVRPSVGGVAMGGYWRPQHLATRLPHSVRERSLERSRALALPAVQGRWPRRPSHDGVSVVPLEVSHIDSRFLHVITIFSIIHIFIYMRHTWVGEQTKKSYKNFVGQIDMMTDEQVRWTTYP
jgi:hypothetical protein